MSPNLETVETEIWHRHSSRHSMRYNELSPTNDQWQVTTRHNREEKKIQTIFFLTDSDFALFCFCFHSLQPGMITTDSDKTGKHSLDSYSKWENISCLLFQPLLWPYDWDKSHGTWYEHVNRVEGTKSETKTVAVTEKETDRQTPQHLKQGNKFLRAPTKTSHLYYK